MIGAKPTIIAKQVTGPVAFAAGPSLTKGEGSLSLTVPSLK